MAIAGCGGATLGRGNGIGAGGGGANCERCTVYGELAGDGGGIGGGIGGGAGGCIASARRIAAVSPRELSPRAGA
ncbi:MAG TPA: hypothetical protein VI504_11425 [Candidatus Eisenbacteria bacterium]